MTSKKKDGPVRRQADLKQLLSIVAAALVAVTARSVLADHYTVPSGSMLPTVEEGDRIVVDKRAYGLRLPFSEVYLLESDGPASGDVVVVASPVDGTTLLKRVVAGPGDVVEVRGGRIFLNGEPAHISDSAESGLVKTLSGRAHPIHLDRGGGPDYGPERIAEGRYLVMGDNRGDSHDGRIFGLVHRGAIRGRAHAVYWSEEEGLAWRPL